MNRRKAPSIKVEIPLDDLVLRLKEELNGGPGEVQPRLMTLEQAGRYLGRSGVAVKGLLRNKVLKRVALGDRRVFLDRVDLDAAIDAHKV